MTRPNPDISSTVPTHDAAPVDIELSRAAATSTPHGLGSSRLAQLTRDLALTPEQRVRVAEETLCLTVLRQVPTNNASIGFDRYEDFLDWKRKRDL